MRSHNVSKHQGLGVLLRSRLRYLAECRQAKLYGVTDV